MTWELKPKTEEIIHDFTGPGLFFKIWEKDALSRFKIDPTFLTRLRAGVPQAWVHRHYWDAEIERKSGGDLTFILKKGSLRMKETLWNSRIKDHLANRCPKVRLKKARRIPIFLWPHLRAQIRLKALMKSFIIIRWSRRDIDHPVGERGMKSYPGTPAGRKLRLITRSSR